MGIKEGYKQTDIGILPNDWLTPTIDSSCKLINGRGFKPHEWKTEGMPIIRIQNLNGSDDFNYYQGTYDKKIEITSGQLLFAWSGSKGTSFGPHIWTGEPGLLNYHTWKIQIKETVEKEFFLHALKKLTKNIEDNAHGASALVHTQKWEMEKFRFPCPPTKAEQTAIATTLRNMDALIGSMEKLIEKKKVLKQGAMQELLRPKEGWEVKKLGSIGKTYGGLSGKSKKDFYQGKYPYIPFLNVINNPVININHLDYVNLKNGEIQNKAIVGDLFFNGSSETPDEVGMCSVLLQDLPNLYLNSFCFGFRLNKEHNNDGLYLSYFFRSNEGRKLFFSMAQGATRYNLSKANFLSLEIKLPELKKQKEIASILNDMDLEITDFNKTLSKYKLLKQSMMQQLLTGKIRLV